MKLTKQETLYAELVAENATLKRRIATLEKDRMRPVFDSGMALFLNKRHGIARQAHGFDCEGEYWILRGKWRDVKRFRSACEHVTRNSSRSSASRIG